MSILEAVIRALLYLCAIALCFFLIVWVLGALGLALPPMVLTILKVMLILIAILVLVRTLWPPLSSVRWFP